METNYKLPKDFAEIITGDFPPEQWEEVDLSAVPEMTAEGGEGAAAAKKKSKKKKTGSKRVCVKIHHFDHIF